MMRIVTTTEHYPVFKKWLEGNTCLEDSRPKMVPSFGSRDRNIYHFRVDLEDGLYTWTCIDPGELEFTLSPPNEATKAMLKQRFPKPPEAPQLNDIKQTLEKMHEQLRDVCEELDGIRERTETE